MEVRDMHRCVLVLCVLTVGNGFEGMKGTGSKVWKEVGARGQYRSKPEVPGDPRSRLDAASEPPAPPQSPPPSLVPLSPLPTPPPPLSSLPPMRLAAARWPSITAGRWTPPLSSPLVPVPLSLALYWLPNPRCHHRLPSAAAPRKLEMDQPLSIQTPHLPGL